MIDNRLGWVAIGLGVVALIAGGVGLALALNTSNDAATNDDVTSEIATLRSEIQRKVGVSLKKGEKASKQQAGKAEGKAGKAEARARKAGKNLTKAEKKQRALNAKTSAQIETLEAKVKQGSKAEAEQADEIQTLKASVKRLQQTNHQLKAAMRQLRKDTG